MTTTTTAVFTTCSGCFADLDINVETGTLITRVSSNGKRGSLHVPAHDVTADVFNDGDLLTWDCPVCEYADSYDLTSED